MRPYRLTGPPSQLRRARLDNPSTRRCGAGLALLPANLLPFKAQWQRLANNLPRGGVLIILPEEDQRLRKPIEAVATHLKDEGYRVTTIPAHHFT